MTRSHIIPFAFMAGAFASLLFTSGPGVAQGAREPAANLARDLSVEQRPIYDVGQLQPIRSLDVDVAVDKPDSTYAVGQPLRLFVTPHRDAYITVVDVGSSGKVSLLYPNYFQQGRRVHADMTVVIPTRSASWQITVGGPPGVDLIQVIASRRRLSLPEISELVRATVAAPLITLGHSGEDVARDLVAQLKPEPAASAPGSPRFGIRNVLVRIVGDLGSL